MVQHRIVTGSVAASFGWQWFSSLQVPSKFQAILQLLNPSLEEILLIYFLPLCHMKTITTLGIMSTYWKKGKGKRFNVVSYIYSFDQDHKSQLRSLNILSSFFHCPEPGHMATSGCRHKWEAWVSCFLDSRMKSMWRKGDWSVLGVANGVSSIGGFSGNVQVFTLNYHMDAI